MDTQGCNGNARVIQLRAPRLFNIMAPMHMYVPRSPSEVLDFGVFKWPAVMIAQVIASKHLALVQQY
jgi:hypothetical protein